MKKKSIGIIILLLLVIAVFGTLYLTTDLFKTPEQLFFKHFTGIIMEDMSYEELLLKMQDSKGLSMESEGEISGKITSKNEDIQKLGKILEKGKVTYNTKTIGQEDKMQQNIKLNYNDNNIIDLEVLKNGEQYGIKVDELYNQYISVENNDLKSVFEKLGMDGTNMPNKITELDCYKLLNVDEDTLNHIKITFYKVLKENIPVEAYSVEKDITIKIDNDDIITNAYKLTLNDEQISTITVKILEKLKDDDKILSLIIEKNNMLRESFVSLGEEELTTEKLIKIIETEITKINEKQKEENRTVSIVVYKTIDGKEKIDIIEKKEDIEISKLEIATIDTENNEKLIISSFMENMKMDIQLSHDEVKSNAVVKIDNKEVTLEININEEIKTTENVSITNFDSNNSVKLNDMTKTEIEQLAGKIYLKALYTLPKKIYLLGIDFTDYLLPTEDKIIENEIVEETII